MKRREVRSKKRRSKRWDTGEERRAGTLATVAAARSRWRSEERLWPPCLVTLQNTRQTPVTHTVHTHSQLPYRLSSTSSFSFHQSIFHSLCPLCPNSCILLNNVTKSIHSLSVYFLFQPRRSNSLCLSLCFSVCSPDAERHLGPARVSP